MNTHLNRIIKSRVLPALCGISVVLSSLALSSLVVSADQLPLPSQGCSFSGSFIQTKEVAGLPEPLLSEGVFYYHCDAGVIWKTTSPVSQTLVFEKAGKAFSVQEQIVSPLKSAQGEVLGRLLNSLIGGDQAEISEQFDVTSRTETTPAPAAIETEETETETETRAYPSIERFSLKPRKRALKRGLKLIELDLIQAEVDQPVSVDIAMLGRKGEWTRISSTKTASLDEPENPVQQCAGVLFLTELECDLLHESL